MKVADFRQAVATEVEAWRAGYAGAGAPVPVFYENGPEPDAAKLSYWLEVELRFYSSSEVEIGKGGAGRTTGVIALSLYWKKGEGAGAADEILDSLHKALRRKRLGAGAFTTHGERMTPPPDFYSWYRTGYMIPFVLTERGD